MLVAQWCLTLTSWTVAGQAPLSIEFSRQEYWSGLPCPSPGDLPSPGIEPGSPTLQADSLLSEPPGQLLATGDIEIDLKPFFSIFVTVICAFFSPLIS